MTRARGSFGWAAGTAATLAGALLLSAGGAAAAHAGPSPDEPNVAVPGTVPATCLPAPEPEPPEYYAFPLVSTERLAGTGASEGEGRVSFPASSPYGVALEPDGSYRYDLWISTRRLPEPRSGRYVVWVTTPELDRIRAVGPLPEDGELRDTVSWNKFLVVVTLEPEDAPVLAGENGAPSASEEEPRSWRGPVVLRGMSRSGQMHTMAGHGPFEQENCAAFGY